MAKNIYRFPLKQSFIYMSNRYKFKLEDLVVINGLVNDAYADGTQFFHLMTDNQESFARDVDKKKLKDFIN